MKKYSLVLFVICLMISACAPNSNAAPIIGTWKLTLFGPADSPTPAVTDMEATLTFGKDGSLSGSGGCNQLGGDYKVNGNQITFGSIVSTMMACADPQMEQESIVNQVLTDTSSFKIEGNTLTITNKDMVLVLVAVAAE